MTYQLDQNTDSTRRAICTTIGIGVLGSLSGCLGEGTDGTSGSDEDPTPGLPESGNESTRDDEPEVYAPLGESIATFQNVDPWTVHGNVTIEQVHPDSDTGESDRSIPDPDQRRSDGPVAYIDGNPGSIELDLVPAIDISERDITVDARIDQPESTNLRLQCTDTDGETTSLVNGYYRTIHPNGWLTFSPSIGEVGADLTNIETILISIDGGENSPTYWLDELRFPERTTDTGQFVFTFDDNTRDIYESFFPIMREFDFPGSAAIHTSLIGESNRLSLAEMDELDAAGWSIDNHTHTFEALHGQSKDEQRREIETATGILQDYGFDPQSIMYPGGQCDRTTLELASEIDQYGFLAFTSPVKGIAPSIALQESPQFINRSRSSTFEEGRTVIDRAIEYGAAYPAYWHTAGSDGEITEQAFREICAYLDEREQAGEIEIVLPHEIGQ